MPFPVVLGAQLMCTFGVAPSNLVVVPQGKPVQIEKKFAATIADSVPMVNILPFGSCIAPTNPAGMAKPVPTPAPCIPIFPNPMWAPLAPTKFVNNKPILLQGSVLTCVWLGIVQVVNPGTTKEQVS